MLESDIVKKYADGEYNGIVFDGNFAYIPLRLTGTGKVERVEGGLARIVDRKMDLFSLDKFMEAYSNLPVVLNHPTDNDGNFIRAGIETPEYFIGNTIHSYIINDEIWVIARIHNKEVVEYLANNDASTSPHFMTKELKEDDYFIEVPVGVNSLAIVANGFWDKKSIIPAVDNSEFSVIDDKGEVMEKEVKTEEIKEEEKADSVMEKEISKADSAVEEKKEVKEEKEKNEDSLKEDKETKDVADEAFVSNIGISNYENGYDGKKEATLNIQAKGDTIEEADKLLMETAKKISGEGELVDGDDFTKEDEEREEILEIISNVADSAPVEVGVKKIYIGQQRLKPHAVIRRFASANSALVDDKYKPLIDKIDSAGFVEIGKDIISNIQKNIEIKSKSVHKAKDDGSKIIKHRDGTYSYKLI